MQKGMARRLWTTACLVAMLHGATPLALKRRLRAPAKPKKRIKKQPPLPKLPENPPQAAAPALVTSPEEHMAIVEAAVAARASEIRSALAEEGLYACEAFVDAGAVGAMAKEARGLDATLVPSQSTRWDGTQTVAYDKAGVRSTQILGGPSYAMAPRLTEYVVALTKSLSAAVDERPLSPSRQTNKLAVCDAVAASYPKHIDNGGGDDPRMLTAILYLAGCPRGGEFRAYAATEDRVLAEVAPRPGTFVCFWSDRLVHDVAEVAECAGPEDARWALTVWLCTDDPAAVEATPPAVLEAHFPDADANAKPAAGP